LLKILLRNLTNGSASELSDGMRARLDRLVDAPAKAGRFARIRLAADVPVLFKHAPSWTKSRIIPLSIGLRPMPQMSGHPENIRTTSDHPELFGLTKQPFLEIFGQIGVPQDDLRTFAEWLTSILIANQVHDAGYPLTTRRGDRCCAARAPAHCRASVIDWRSRCKAQGQKKRGPDGKM
jgi:hypothetical protein